MFDLPIYFFQEGPEGWAKKAHWIKIRQSEFSYIAETSKCSDFETFYECLVKAFINSPTAAICGKKCLPPSFTSIIGSAKNVSDKSKHKIKIPNKFALKTAFG